ncbi:LysM peptidoglycan-binding domain-containing protein [Paenibacillus sp. NPDC056579]|uniref:LysM peptidoglycan-binding domain-containing protein n=1 Tax=unclassified Paenibacillus TaxID=185978 RepID=UPI001EF7FA00|nr:LysM peptidoglycan-binding domain-containing protein [Paenibacillus sp. H1-7]ULL15712.1 LysM peptidoglycan-binding domain-containing protein [Paenibacillus sp. H1-7]
MYMNEQLIRSTVSTHNRNHKANKKSMNKVKLARLGALLAAGLLIIILSLFISLFGGDQDALAAANGSALKSTVEVDRGDTLWSIANEHLEQGQNVSEYIYELKRVNQLKSNVLHEGQILVLP